MSSTLRQPRTSRQVAAAGLPVVLAALLAQTAVVGAATVAVPGDAPTIARGLALARPGDIVLVSCGTYREHDLVIPAGVSLWSGSLQPGCVVIDAGGAGRVLLCEGVDSTSTVVGFTLTGGRAIGDGDAGRGGAILCRNASPRLDKCVLRDNVAREGGALAVVGSGRPVVAACRFWRNEALNAGGAVIWRGVRGGRLDTCTLFGNVAGSAGGGVYAVDAQVLLVDCTLAGNTAGVAGAGVALDASPARLIGCTLTDNRTDADGGVVLALGSSALLERCLIAFNDADEVAIEGGEVPQFLRCNLYGNVGPGWAPPIADQRDRLGNLTVDPLFCDRPRDDYRLRPESPCLLAGGESIGAYGRGCGTP